MSSFYLNLSKHLGLFEGCGNMLGIVPLSLAGYEGEKDSWKKDPELRKLLSKWGQQINSDSVMVLTGDPRNRKEQGYHVEMAVFEPKGSDNSGMPGCISTMCGNGVRAVAAWVREFDETVQEVDIKTLSGLRKIVIEGDEYIVDMGEFTSDPKDFTKYVNKKFLKTSGQEEFIHSPIPGKVLRAISPRTKASVWSIGLNGDRDAGGSIEGEPHIVIEIGENEVKSIQDLRELAVKLGPSITKNLQMFPQEINVNFVVLKGHDESDNFIIWNCTHERNLGDDPDHSVTAACGTGSTVAGGVVLKKYGAEIRQNVLVKCVGGDLTIASSGEKPRKLFMKGPARRISHKVDHRAVAFTESMVDNIATSEIN